LLLQSNHDVSNFSFKLTIKTKFQKKKGIQVKKSSVAGKEKTPFLVVLATKGEYKASKKFLKNGQLLLI